MVRAAAAVSTLGLASISAVLAQTPAQVAPEPAAAPSPQAADPRSECARLAPAAWPGGTATRRLHIARMRLGLRACIGDADFLAAFGGLLLEDGEHAEALTWLERAVLLDPGNLGVQADHALALDALGEPAALRELAARLLVRSDLPAALRAKLSPPDDASRFQLPQARLGAPLAQRQTWGFQGEVQLQLGYESNLDRSPSLTELTLSIPEGPLVLPVISTPRKAAASLASAALQLGYAPVAGVVLRSGLNMNSRRSLAEPETDWRQVQWVQQLAIGGKSWSGLLDGSASWVSGPLNEPYRLLRLGAALDAASNGCRGRLSYVHEQREQAQSTQLDASTSVWAADIRCALPFAPTWALSAAYSQGQDRPESATRPGGMQRLQGAGLRLAGPVAGRTQLDLGLRLSRVKDETGFSALLEQNAVRWLRLHQFSAELQQPLDDFGWKGLSATLQWQQVNQESNLKLFSYRADSVYAGLRWAW